MITWRAVQDWICLRCKKTNDFFKHILFIKQTSFSEQTKMTQRTNKKEKDLLGDASLQHSGPPRLHSHVSDVKKLDGKIKVDICRHRQWCKFGVLESSSRIKVLWNLFYINHYLTVIFVFLSLLAWWFIRVAQIVAAWLQENGERMRKCRGNAILCNTLQYSAILCNTL